MAQEYHKNALKSVRSAINRHLKDIGRNIDIVEDKDFSYQIQCLVLNLNSTYVMGCLVQLSIILLFRTLSFLEFLSTKNNIVALRFKVWYALTIHIVSCSIEFYQQLSKDSIKFVNDEESREYLTITHETHQQNYQGGIEDSSEKADDKRMYSTDSDSCPVKAVKFYLSKCHPNSKSLFNQCSRDASRSNSNHFLVWYTETPVKVKEFTES